MTTAVRQAQRSVGYLLRTWREHRRLSQLQFALQAGISTRHLSFVETGRSHPSREMILRIAAHLDVPLRARNHLLLVAGYAPAYQESALESPQMEVVRAAIRKVLTGHEPYPALVVDRRLNLVEANESLSIFTDGAAPELLAPVANCMRLALHPDGLAPRIVNLGEWRAHLLGRLRRIIANTADPTIVELYEEIAAYPCDEPEPELDPHGARDILAPLRIRYCSHELSFFSTIATFGMALDISVSELSIESFYPADAETGVVLRRLYDQRHREGR